MVEIDDKVYVPTTTPFRGLPSNNAVAFPTTSTSARPRWSASMVTTYDAHPGSLFDQTDSYNFEDLRNGVFQINNTLQGAHDYHTDNNEADAFFGDDQKELAGSLPWDIQRTASRVIACSWSCSATTWCRSSPSATVSSASSRRAA